MDTKAKICFGTMFFGGLFIVLSRDPYGLVNIPLVFLGVILVVGPVVVFYLGESKKS